jgi:hypothetical protein
MEELTDVHLLPLKARPGAKADRLNQLQGIAGALPNDPSSGRIKELIDTGGENYLVPGTVKYTSFNRGGLNSKVRNNSTGTVA